MASRPKQKYWFPTKRFGWGWGLPITWQGWSVFVAFLALLPAGHFLLPRRGILITYPAYIIALGFVLVGICWMKGQPPRWRWGNEPNE